MEARMLQIPKLIARIRFPVTRPTSTHSTTKPSSEGPALDGRRGAPVVEMATASATRWPARQVGSCSDRLSGPRIGAGQERGER
jgi:hypothetical protein